MRRLSVLLFVAIGLAGSLFGEESASGRGADIVQLQARITALEGDETVPEVSRDAAVTHLRDAIAFLEKKAQFEKREADYRAALSNGARETREMQAEAAALDEAQGGPVLPASIKDPSDGSQIEEALAQEQAALRDARSELVEVESKSKEVQSSPALISDRMNAVQSELDEVEALLRGSTASGDDAVDETREVLLRSRRDSLVAEAKMLEQELLSHDIRVLRVGVERDLAQKRLGSIHDRIEAVQKLANAQLNSDVDRVEALLRRARISGASVDPSVAVLVEELEKLISETRRVSSQSKGMATRLKERETLLAKITEDFANVRRQIEVGGLEGSFARILLERRRSLPRPLEERQLLRKIRQDLTEAQRTLYFLENQSAGGYRDGSEVSSQAARRDGDATGAPQQEPKIRELSAARDSLREDLADGCRRLIQELGELDLVEHQIDQKSASYREFLSEQLFWERSSPMIRGTTFQAISPGLAWTFGSMRAREFVHQLSELPSGFYLALAALLAVLIGFRRKLRAGLEAAGNQTRRISTDYYLNTIKAFLLTVLLSLPLPLALLAFGIAFRNQPDATEWSFGVGTAFLAIGMFMFVVQFTKEMAAEKGLGEYHFKWGTSNLARVRLLLRRLVPIYLPCSLVLCILAGESSPEHLDGLGRLVSLLTVIGVGTVFILFAKPEAAGEAEDGVSTYKFFNGRGAFWFTVVVTVGLVVLLLTGFVVTTIILMVELQKSVLAVFAAIIVHGLVLRWFEIRERRMALAETIAERRARQEAAEDAEDDEEKLPRESEEMLVDEAEKDQRLSLIQVGEQLRNVIRFLIGVGLITTLYYLWAKATPLLTGLDAVYIYGTFSIADLAITTLVIGLTVSITRNLPGLLEILVFRLLDVAPGTRTAMTTLAQYVVIAVGLLVASRQAEIDWSQLGWIAAALSVGLGFGLQEVVANFVCGIILLFERPLRVGDVVTVAGVSGTVSRIQMRATTIINWEREELVVPNKEFITGSLLNMTLSSPMNRVVIPVGVAYGSDTEKVLRILSEVAKGVDGVMEDPAPVITFEAFGDSSLDFTIRAYLPTRENRLGVITELHRRIDARFAEAGIEIPFPQRDLHVRSVSEGIQLREQAKS